MPVSAVVQQNSDSSHCRTSLHGNGTIFGFSVWAQIRYDTNDGEKIFSVTQRREQVSCIRGRFGLYDDVVTVERVKKSPLIPVVVAAWRLGDRSGAAVHVTGEQLGGSSL